jgi:hypothetical protein
VSGFKTLFICLGFNMAPPTNQLYLLLSQSLEGNLAVLGPCEGEFVDVYDAPSLRVVQAGHQWLTPVILATQEAKISLGK